MLREGRISFEPKSRIAEREVEQWGGWTRDTLSICTGLRPCERPSLQLPHDGHLTTRVLSGGLQAVSRLVSDGCGDMAMNLHDAAADGDVAEARRLVAAGADVEEQRGQYGRRPLHRRHRTGRWRQ